MKKALLPVIIASLIIVAIAIGFQITHSPSQDKLHKENEVEANGNHVMIGQENISKINSIKSNANKIDNNNTKVASHPQDKPHKLSSNKVNIDQSPVKKKSINKVNTDQIYAEYAKVNPDRATARRIFTEQLKSKLNNLKRVEIILPKDGPELGRYLVDMDPDETLTVGTISTNSKDFNGFKKEIRNMLEPADKKMMASSKLYNTWLRLIFDDDTSVLAMFSIKEYDFFIFDNKKKGSSDEPVYVYCHSTDKLRQILLKNIDQSYINYRNNEITIGKF